MVVERDSCVICIASADVTCKYLETSQNNGKTRIPNSQLSHELITPDIPSACGNQVYITIIVGRERVG